MQAEITLFWNVIARRVDRLVAALDGLDARALDQPCEHPRRGTLTGREVLLVVLRHVAEHEGQAQLTLDLVRARRTA